MYSGFDFLLHEADLRPLLHAISQDVGQVVVCFVLPGGVLQGVDHGPVRSVGDGKGVVGVPPLGKACRIGSDGLSQLQILLSFIFAAGKQAWREITATQSVTQANSWNPLLSWLLKKGGLSIQ